MFVLVSLNQSEIVMLYPNAVLDIKCLRLRAAFRFALRVEQRPWHHLCFGAAVKDMDKSKVSCGKNTLRTSTQLRCNPRE